MNFNKKMRFEQENKLKKCFFLVSEDKKEFRLFDSKTEEYPTLNFVKINRIFRLYLFATYDDFEEHFLIYSYDKEETAFNFSAPIFKLQMLPSSIFFFFKSSIYLNYIENHFVLWSFSCESCDLLYKKYCQGVYQKIRQQLMFVEHVKF